MKLVSIFIPGSIGDAVRKVNDLHNLITPEGVIQFNPATRTLPVAPGQPPKWPEQGYACIARVTDHAASVLVKTHGAAA